MGSESTQGIPEARVIQVVDHPRESLQLAWKKHGDGWASPLFVLRTSSAPSLSSSMPTRRVVALTSTVSRSEWRRLSR